MKLTAFDVETYRIRRGLLAPKLVCTSYDDGETAEVLAGRDGVEWFRKQISDPNVILAAHNASFDFGVMAAEDDRLIPLIFKAYDEGRVICTKISQKMIDNASGNLKYEYDEDKEEYRKAKYDLQHLVYRHLGVFLPKDNTWRLDYHRLDGVPVSEYPPDAYDYSLQDSIYARRLRLFQKRAIDDDEIPGEAHVNRTAWALALLGNWGVRTEPTAVAKLKAEYVEKYEAWVKLAQGFGLVKTPTRATQKRSRDMKAIKARIEALYLKFKLEVPLSDSGKNISTNRETITFGAHPKLPRDQVVEVCGEKFPCVDVPLKCVAEVVRYEKLLKTYVKVLEMGVQYPITPSYNEMVETSRTSCVAKGTMIEVVRDSSKFPRGIPIEDVRPGDLAYGFDDDRQLVLRKVTWAGQTGIKKVIRLHWSGGRSNSVKGFVDLTPDHPVRLVSGHYIAAGKLRPKDRVAALRRSVSKTGYAVLWPTNNSSVREHRFVYEQVSGNCSSEHVHHKNENKLDNRFENLEGMKAKDHLSLHARTPSAELRLKRAINLRLRWKVDREFMLAIQPRGTEKNNFRAIPKDQIVELLWKYKGKPTLAAKELGADYEKLQRCMDEYNIDFVEIARCFTAHGQPITRENVEKWALEFGSRPTKESLKSMGLGYYRWKQIQQQHGFVPNNHVITRIQELDEPVPVYDLTIEDVHNFIANEICVHNCASPNLQNLGRGGGVRKCFISRDVFAFCDYGTLEMRSLAQTVLDLKLLKINGEVRSDIADALIADRDLHVDLATEILFRSYEDLMGAYTSGDKVVENTRQFAKLANYSLSGGMGVDSFVEYARGADVELSRETAQQSSDAFRRRWREMPLYFQFCSEMLDDSSTAKYVVHPRTGMVRGDVRYTALCNHYFQHLAAVGATDALYCVVKEMYTVRSSPLYGCRAWLFAHDEIGMEIPYGLIGAEAAHHATMRLQQIMIDRMKVWCPDVPITADAAMTRKWFKGAKAKYVDGLMVPVMPEEKIIDGKKKTVWVPDLVGLAGADRLVRHAA